jgi:hypothetical protein
MAKPVIVASPSSFHCISEMTSYFHIPTMDASNKPANQHPSEPHVEHVPDLHGVHVPDFKDPSLRLALSSGDSAPRKTMFLDCDWMTPDLWIYLPFAKVD